MSDLNVKLTKHAREKMAERDLTFQEVVDVLKLPELVTTTHAPGYARPNQKPQRKYFKGEICLVVAEEEFRGEVLLTVITVLWRNQEQWSSEQMRGRKS
jgi:hypothetical protein